MKAKGLKTMKEKKQEERKVRNAIFILALIAGIGNVLWSVI